MLHRQYKETHHDKLAQITQSRFTFITSQKITLSLHVLDFKITNSPHSGILMDSRLFVFEGYAKMI